MNQKEYLAKLILEKLEEVDNGRLSLNIIKEETGNEIYELQESINELIKLELIKVKDAKTKEYPNNQMLSLTPKAQYYLKRNIDDLWQKEKTEKMGSVFKRMKLLIGRGNLRDVIEILHDEVKDSNHLNYLIMQSARYYDIEKAINMDIVQWENAKIEKAKITKSILDLIDELEANEKEEQIYLPEEEEIDTMKIENNAPKLVDLRPSIKSQDNWEKEGLVLRFLTVFDKWYFSPLRINKWGARQNGFGELGDISSKQIKVVLERLLEEGKVKKTNSKKGNPIYKIKM